MRDRLGGTFEPDAWFFVESWTISAAAATENLLERHRPQKDRERRSKAFRELDDFTKFSIMELVEHDANALPDRYCEAFAGAYGTTCSQQLYGEIRVSREARDTARANTADITGLDGCMPPTCPLTMEVACRLLGVTSTCTNGQIKTAYRRLAKLHHPDLRSDPTGEDGERSKAWMATINEAYRLLRSNFPATPGCVAD